MTVLLFFIETDFYFLQHYLFFSHQMQTYEKWSVCGRLLKIFILRQLVNFFLRLQFKWKQSAVDPCVIIMIQRHY